MGRPEVLEIQHPSEWPLANERGQLEDKCPSSLSPEVCSALPLMVAAGLGPVPTVRLAH